MEYVQGVNEADPEVQDSRCKLATRKYQDLHAPGKQPGRRMLYETERMERSNNVGSY